MSDPKSRQFIPTITTPFERLSERARRVAELADSFASLVRQVDAISPSEAANLNTLGGRVAVAMLAGINAEVQS